MVKLNPYIFFTGNCEEAFNFYKSVLGGEFSYMARYSEMPEGSNVSPDEAAKIMHVSLPLADGTMLMGSDVPISRESMTVIGNNFSLSITPNSEDEARRIFNELSESGNVTMPLDKTFWGSLFGMFTDKFGMNWMIDYELPK